MSATNRSIRRRRKGRGTWSADQAFNGNQNGSSGKGSGAGNQAGTVSITLLAAPSYGPNSGPFRPGARVTGPGIPPGTVIKGPIRGGGPGGVLGQVSPSGSVFKPPPLSREVSVDPLIGWRVWRVEKIRQGFYLDLNCSVSAYDYPEEYRNTPHARIVHRSHYVLQSYAQDTIWWPRESMTGKPSDHGPTGVWAFRDPDRALLKLDEFAYQDQLCAYGAVRLWGEVIEHEDGFRAENAEVFYIAYAGYAPQSKGEVLSQQSGSSSWGSVLTLQTPLFDSELLLEELRRTYFGDPSCFAMSAPCRP